jgi:LuxR family maltose regulon positive regulatory protein
VPGLPGTVVAALTARTEGWAAGLQLAALSLRGHAKDAAGFVAAFSGSHRFVLDYLADEVLDGQPGPVRAFLLETSVLERLTGELCDAVTGRAGSQAMLEGIERAGLFLVPLDEVRGWWRYHHLFAALLRARLQAEQPGHVAVLHRKGAAWCEEHGLADDAVRHALAAGDATWAARLVERHVEELLGRSEGATLRRWLSALPAESVRDRPRLCLAQAYSAAQGFQLEALEALLDDAERAFAASGDEPYEDPAGRPVSVLANVPAGIAFLRASLARLRGDTAPAADYNRQALAHLGEDEWLMRSFVRWNRAGADWLDGRLGPAERGLAGVLAELRAAGEAVRRAGGEPAEVFHAVEGGAGFFTGFLAMRVCYDLGQVQRARGNLDAALAIYRQALEVARADERQPPHMGLAHVGLAQVLYERDELAAALDHATRGVTLCRQLAFTPSLATGLAILARIRHAQGDAAGAAEAMGEAGQAGLSPQVAALLNPVPSQRARLLLAHGDVGAAAQWTTAAGLSPDDEPDYPQEPAYLLLARVLLAQSHPGPALTLLQRLLDAAASQGRAGSIIEIGALRALALAARGDHASALAALTEALTPGRRHGYIRVFADEGTPMRALLTRLPDARPDQQHAADRIDPGYLAALLRACGPADATPPRRAAAAPPGLAEPLTGRELEVLRLLAAGKSNQRIAHDLVVALDTVKRHVTHILGKLGAANRTEAAARARQLGLIP